MADSPQEHDRTTHDDAADQPAGAGAAAESRFTISFTVPDLAYRHKDAVKLRKVMKQVAKQALEQSGKTMPEHGQFGMRIHLQYATPAGLEEFAAGLFPPETMSSAHHTFSQAFSGVFFGHPASVVQFLCTKAYGPADAVAATVWRVEQKPAEG